MTQALHNQICTNICSQKSSSAMARTRQNARRSTGCHATRARWAVSLPVKARASSHPMPDHMHSDKLENNDVGSLPHVKNEFSDPTKVQEGRDWPRKDVMNRH